MNTFIDEPEDGTGDSSVDEQDNTLNPVNSVSSPEADDTTTDDTIDNDDSGGRNTQTPPPKNSLKPLIKP